MPEKYDPETDDILIRIRDVGMRVETENCGHAKKALIVLLRESFERVGKDWNGAVIERVNCALHAIEKAHENFDEKQIEDICGVLRDNCRKCMYIGVQHPLNNKLMNVMAKLHRKGRKGAKEALVELAKSNELQIAGMACDILARLGFDRRGNCVRGRKPGHDITGHSVHYNEGTRDKKISRIMNGA